MRHRIELLIQILIITFEYHGGREVQSVLQPLSHHYNPLWMLPCWVAVRERARDWLPWCSDNECGCRFTWLNHVEISCCCSRQDKRRWTQPWETLYESMIAVEAARSWGDDSSDIQCTFFRDWNTYHGVCSWRHLKVCVIETQHIGDVIDNREHIKKLIISDWWSRACTMKKMEWIQLCFVRFEKHVENKVQGIADGNRRGKCFRV